AGTVCTRPAPPNTGRLTRPFRWTAFGAPTVCRPRQTATAAARQTVPFRQRTTQRQAARRQTARALPDTAIPAASPLPPLKRHGEPYSSGTPTCRMSWSLPEQEPTTGRTPSYGDTSTPTNGTPTAARGTNYLFPESV